MRFGWLIPVVLLVVVATTVAGWMLARRAGERSGKKGWVANTGFLRDLPKYQALVRRTRSSLAMARRLFPHRRHRRRRCRPVRPSTAT